MEDKSYDVMAPVELRSGKTIWCKVGMAWPSQGKKYVMTMNLTTIPIGHTGPLELFFFEKDGSQT